jgi:hypothetical protein
VVQIRRGVWAAIGGDLMSGGRTKWGQGRPLVIRELDAIKAELSSGSSLKLAYESRAERLGITYPAYPARPG